MVLSNKQIMKQTIKYNRNLFGLWFKHILIGYPMKKDYYRRLITQYEFNRIELWLFNRISVKD